jgi:hypothetical protein
LLYPQYITPLHFACDFIQLLSEKGADPNAQDHRRMTLLMVTLALAPCAATFLLEWPTTDVNITARSGASFLALVRDTVKGLSDFDANPETPNRVEAQFLLQQRCEIEEMLVERETVDTGITAVE